MLDDDDGDGVGFCVGDGCCEGWCHSPREAFLCSLTVAMATIGGSAVPFHFPMAVLLLLLLLSSSSFTRPLSFGAFATRRCHSHTPVYWWEHVGAPGRIIVVNLSRGAAQTSSLFAVENQFPHSPLEVYFTPPDGVLRRRSCAFNHGFEVVVRKHNLLAMLIRLVLNYS